MLMQLDKFREECGVVAIYNHADAARLAFLGLHQLQHRGQESAGIATSDGQHLHIHKNMGLVAEVFQEEGFSRLVGTHAIGHTRYSTAGDSALANAQPIMVDCNKGPIAIAHNGNLVNARQIRRRLEDQGSIFQTNSDTEVILHLIAQSREATLAEALADALRRVEGAFSLVLVTRDQVLAVRDPRGFRPLAIARLKAAGPRGEDTIVFASETCAFDIMGANYERDVKPGEIVVIRDGVMTSRFYAPEQPQANCIFEHVYFSRPDSSVFGLPVQAARERMGRLLALETGVEADVVVPVPDSGVSAAIGYAEQSGIPFRMGLIRSHYVGRTFIQPDQKMRDTGVKLKLNPVRNLLQGRRVVLIDDSIVRGTTSRRIVRMLRRAGAAEVHLRISCPPTISSCYYGVDTPTSDQLIAANKSVEEIRRFIEADSLAYLSLEGLRSAVDDTPVSHFCSGCYTGQYPTKIVDVEEILPAAAAAR